MIFGYVDFKVIGDNYEKIYKYILKNNVFCTNISERKGVLYIRTGVEYKREIEEQFLKLGVDYEIIKRKGFVYNFKRIFSKKGLIFGGLVAFAISFILSNSLLKLEILCDDNQIKKEITAVLKQNGVDNGTFIPNLNCTVLERELKKKVDGISWAGISVKGPILIIDVVENIDKPEYRNIRMPCNLIATHDAIIDKIELYDGQLVTTVGSGAAKGDILVSGTVVTEDISYKDGKEIKDISTKYVRSIGKIYGTFTEKQTFFQPFTDTKKIISDKTIEHDYLKLFDANIPLFIKDKDKKYIEENSTSNFSIFGFETPIGITHSRLNEYNFKTYTYSEIEAKELANEQATKYEHNFLKDFVVKDAKRTEKTTKDGVEITVEYNLYGVISQEVDFFVSK